MTDFVVHHDPTWVSDFAAEARALRFVLGEAITLHHIGSTAIPGILAKPVIDLLGVMSSFQELDSRGPAMRSLGYEAMGENGIEGRRYFLKEDATGRRTHHLHVFLDGSPHLVRHLAFRDYLRHHPAKAAHYSLLKARLAEGGVKSREAYLSGKAPFMASRPKPRRWPGIGRAETPRTTTGSTAPRRNRGRAMAAPVGRSLGRPA